MHSGVSATVNSPVEAAAISGAAIPKPAGHSLDFSDKGHADKVLKELPMAEAALAIAAAILGATHGGLP